MLHRSEARKVRNSSVIYVIASQRYLKLNSVLYITTLSNRSHSHEK